jgi:hypothetical protein
MASESTEASFLLERNQKLISESDYSLDLNEEKLALLSKLLPTLQDSENSKFNQLFQDLLQKQSSLKQDFEEKLERQTHLKLDLVEKNSLLAQKVGKLKEKEEEFSIISSLDRSSSIISDNEIQIQEIQKKIREKEDLRKDLIEAEKEHSKSVLDKKDKKRMLIEKQIFYSEKKRKLEEELHGKKKELNNASQSFRDLETGRLEQTISPKSQFFLDTSSIRRATPAKDSTFLDLSSYPSETPAVSTPPQKQVSDSSKTTTYLLLAVIFLLIALIFKLLT